MHHNKSCRQQQAARDCHWESIFLFWQTHPILFLPFNAMRCNFNFHKTARYHMKLSVGTMLVCVCWLVYVHLVLSRSEYSELLGVSTWRWSSTNTPFSCLWTLPSVYTLLLNIEYRLTGRHFTFDQGRWAIQLRSSQLLPYNVNQMPHFLGPQ
jgi:hypothetical protein